MLGKELVDSILEDFETADIREELRATLGYLKKMTLTPDELTAEDARALKEAGVSKQAATDAIKVGFVFNLIDRLADSFDFAVPPPESFAKSAPMMIKYGYKM